MIGWLRRRRVAKLKSEIAWLQCELDCLVYPRFSGGDASCTRMAVEDYTFYQRLLWDAIEMKKRALSGIEDGEPP